MFHLYEDVTGSLISSLFNESFLCLIVKTFIFSSGDLKKSSAHPLTQCHSQFNCVAEVQHGTYFCFIIPVLS